MLAIFCAMAASLPIEFGVVERAISAREAITHGSVELRQIWEHAGVTSEYSATAMFDPAHYRLDIHEGTGLNAGVSAEGARIDALRMFCDGTHVYDRVWSFDTPYFGVRGIRDARLPFYNVRLLGLLRYPGPQFDVGRSFLRGDRLAQHSVKRDDSGAYAVVLRSTDSASAGVRSLDMKIDPDRGWSVVAFEATIVAPAGTVYTVRARSNPEQYDGVWFPSWVRVEQYKGEQLDWSQEIFIDDAQFKSELPKDTFTLEGLGAVNGTSIVSHVPGLRSWTLQSDRVAPPALCERHRLGAESSGPDNKATLQP